MITYIAKYNCIFPHIKIDNVLGELRNIIRDVP